LENIKTTLTVITGYVVILLFIIGSWGSRRYTNNAFDWVWTNWFITYKVL